MNYEEYRNTSKWTKGFWDPALAPLSSDDELYKCNTLYDYEVYNNYIQDPNRIYMFDFFEADNKVLNPFWKDKIVKYILNSHGYRGPSFNSSKKIKIITIGCSHVFGTGIDDSSTWAEQLKQLIRQHDTDDIEVFNLGTPGASIDTNTAQLYQLIDIIKPNIVLWMPPERRRYNLGSNPVYVKYNKIQKNTDRFFNISADTIEHDQLTITPAEFNLKGAEKKFLNYATYGYLDIHTRHQNFCKNFAIIRDLCENNKIIFHSFANFHQVRGLFDFIISNHSFVKKPNEYDQQIIWFLERMQTLNYVNDSNFFDSELSQEDALLDYIIMNNEKNIMKYDSVHLLKTMLEMKEHNYDLSDVDSGIHPKIMARDIEHNGEMFNSFLARLSYNIVKEDIVKLLNTL